jgi:hypothetical protein
MHFRLSNYATVRLHPIAGDEQLQPRARDLLRCLAAPFQREPEITEILLSVMKDQQELRDMLSPQQSATIAALFETIHHYMHGNWEFLFSSLQQNVNIRLKQQGEAPIQSGHKMGKVLTNLGLVDRKPTNKGTVLILSRDTREQVHELQRMHKIGTQTTPEQMDSCPHCKVNAGESTTPSKDPSPKSPSSPE